MDLPAVGSPVNAPFSRMVQFHAGHCAVAGDRPGCSRKPWNGTDIFYFEKLAGCKRFSHSRPDPGFPVNNGLTDGYICRAAPGPDLKVFDHGIKRISLWRDRLVRRRSAEHPVAENSISQLNR